MRKQSGSRQRHFHGPDTGFEEIGVQTVFRSANFLEADLRNLPDFASSRSTFERSVYPELAICA